MAKDRRDLDGRSCLVVGGAGFIGRATCQRLEAEGFRAITADLVDGDSGPDSVSVDISDRSAVRRVFQLTQPTAVINLAYRLGAASDVELDRGFSVNVVGSQNVLECCREFGITRYLYASSIAVYGDQEQRDDRALTEDDDVRPNRPYGWHKVLQEAMATAYREQYGLECAGLRVSTVYGPGRLRGISAPISALLTSARGTVHLPWDHREGFDLIHVEDVADSLVRLLRAPALPHAIYNSGGEYWETGPLAALVRQVRPALHVEFAEDPQSLAHASRLDWSRLRSVIGEHRRTIAERLTEDPRHQRGSI
jgi:nucleoside-diphosphate-sugar epimerase